MLSAVEQVKKEIPSLRVILKGDVIGDPDVYARTVDFIERHHMEEWISIVRFVADIRVVHAAADALVLCSDSEALGRCVVEAMSMGVPPIVTDSGGSHEIVEHGRTGFVVAGNDVGALANALIGALDNANLLECVGAAARKYAVEHLDSRLSSERVMKIFDEMRAS